MSGVERLAAQQLIRYFRKAVDDPAWHGWQVFRSLQEYTACLLALLNFPAKNSCGEWVGVMDNPDFLMRAKTRDQSALGQLLDQFNGLVRKRASESFDQPLRGRIGAIDLVQMTLMDRLTRG